LLNHYKQIDWSRAIPLGTLSQLENQPTKNLVRRLVSEIVVRHAELLVFLFVPGTLNFWQGWGFMGVNLVATVIFWIYFYKRDRELVARRLMHNGVSQLGEQVAAQKFIMFVMRIISISTYVLSGLDNRFGWSRTYVIPVPWWLAALALVWYGCSFLLVIPVLNANRFASSVIQVEAGQTIADKGPYRFVRHPMYSVSIVSWFWIPLALGSFIALPLAMLRALMMVLRLLNEEKILQRELSGYAEYCRRTPYRLIPYVW
jgi:protein-S-isoprenylcysteine O-methyltransferase Ste14